MARWSPSWLNRISALLSRVSESIVQKSLCFEKMIDNCIINYLENYRACIHVLNLTYLMKAILVDCLEGTISHLLGVILPIAKTIDLPHVNSLLQGSFCPKLKESFFPKALEIQVRMLKYWEMKKRTKDPTKIQNATPIHA